MNRKQLIGYVKFLKSTTGTRKDSDKQWTKYDFCLNSMIGNRFNNLNCHTFSKTIGNALEEGMKIELLDYLPVNNQYQDEFGNKKSWFSIELFEVAILEDNNSTNSGVVDLRKETTGKKALDNQSHFTTEQLKEIEKYEQQMKLEEAESQVSLEWMNEFKDLDNQVQQEPEEQEEIISVEEALEAIEKKQQDLKLAVLTPTQIANSSKLITILQNMGVTYNYKTDHLVCYPQNESQSSVIKSMWVKMSMETESEPVKKEIEIETNPTVLEELRNKINNSIDYPKEVHINLDEKLKGKI